MPTLHCPNCQNGLDVPDDLLGRKVRCSACLTVFAAEASAPAETPEPPPEPAAPLPRQFDNVDDFNPRVRRDSTPHRGSTVLTMGIISLATIPLCAPISLILGIVTWVMGASDLRAMSEGHLDHTGRDETRTGQVCGIIAVCVTLLLCGVISVLYAMMFKAMGVI